MNCFLFVLACSDCAGNERTSAQKQIMPLTKRNEKRVENFVIIMAEKIRPKPLGRYHDLKTRNIAALGG
jgi:hypothetical protein